jgi:hypothetical protein
MKKCMSADGTGNIFTTERLEQVGKVLRVYGRVSVYSLARSTTSPNVSQGIRTSKTSGIPAPKEVRHDGRWTIGIAITCAPNAITPPRQRRATTQTASRSGEGTGHRPRPNERETGISTLSPIALTTNFFPSSNNPINQSNTTLASQPFPTKPTQSTKWPSSSLSSSPPWLPLPSLLPRAVHPTR